MKAEHKVKEKELFKEIVGMMPDNQAKEFDKLTYMKIEMCFKGRVFIVYSPRGMRPGQTKLGEQKSPRILTTIKVVDLAVSLEEGSKMTLLDETTGQEIYVRHVPRKLFNYPIYVSLPAEMTLRITEKRRTGERLGDITFPMLSKTGNKPETYTVDNVYLDTPNKFKELYPEVTGEFSY